VHVTPSAELATQFPAPELEGREGKLAQEVLTQSPLEVQAALAHTEESDPA